MRPGPKISMPLCRNWYTGHVESVLRLIACGFDSHQRYQYRLGSAIYQLTSVVPQWQAARIESLEYATNLIVIGCLQHFKSTHKDEVVGFDSQHTLPKRISVCSLERISSVVERVMYILINAPELWIAGGSYKAARPGR